MAWIIIEGNDSNAKLRPEGFSTSTAAIKVAERLKMSLGSKFRVAKITNIRRV